MRLLIYSEYKSLLRNTIHVYFPQVCCLSFKSLHGVFWNSKVLNLDEANLSVFFFFTDDTFVVRAIVILFLYEDHKNLLVELAILSLL